jgi:hypothetical protein
LEAHCFRLANGKLGASELFDPKVMVIGEVNYRRLEYANPRCALCEAGDMIPSEERFFGSTYKPATLPMPKWKLAFSKIKIWLNRKHDLWDQRSVKKQTVP